jgi:hypothetical protein
MSAKRIEKKKAKPTTKKRANRVSKKTAGPVRKGKLPRKEDVPGYTPGLPDMERWPDVAVVLKVRPFYTGKGSVPFSRLRAREIPAFPGMKNDFYLAEP